MRAPRTADHESRWVREPDGRDHRLSHVSGGQAQQALGLGVALGDEVDHIGVGLQLPARLAKGGGESRPRRRERDAAGVPAGAGPIRIQERDVADVAGDALGTALQRSPSDDARTHAARELHEDEVLRLRVDERLLAVGRKVHDVVHEHGRSNTSAICARTSASVQPRMPTGFSPAPSSGPPGSAGRRTARRRPRQGAPVRPADRSRERAHARSRISIPPGSRTLALARCRAVC